MTIYTDNPAGRLHQALTRFRTNASTHPAWVTWAAALDVPTENIGEILRRFSLVVALPGEIETEIAKIDESEYDRDHVMRWQERVVPELGLGLFATHGSPNQLMQANQLAAKFSEATMDSLESCSFVLHRHRPQRVPAESDLERISGLIHELDEILNGDSDIDPELRAFLCYHSAAMARALWDVPVRGIAALEDAFDRAYGAAVRRKDLTARAGETEGTRKAWTKFGQVIVTVATMLNIATSSLALPSAIHQEIEGPKPLKVEIVQEPHAPAPAPDKHPSGEHPPSKTHGPANH